MKARFPAEERFAADSVLERRNPRLVLLDQVRCLGVPSGPAWLAGSGSECASGHTKEIHPHKSQHRRAKAVDMKKQTHF